MRSMRAVLLTFVITLCALWPHATFAEVVSDFERMGESDENGEKFGEIVVRGDLVADGTGWVLVRTMENKSDEPQSYRVEERVMRTETKPEARVNPPPYAVVLRGVTLKLKPHEKRSIGLRLSDALSDEITMNAKRLASIESRRADAIMGDHYTDGVFDETYMVFRVEYYRPLGRGDTAEQPDPASLAQRPEGYSMAPLLTYAGVDGGWAGLH